MRLGVDVRRDHSGAEPVQVQHLGSVADCFVDAVLVALALEVDLREAEGGRERRREAGKVRERER